MKKIPLSRPFINDEIRQAAVRAIDSGSFILSKECEAFEAELASHIGTKHAVLCSNWTSGVFILHQAMGLKADDEVIVPSHTAFPSIEPLMHWKAKPVFVDIDETYCLDADLIEAAITPRTVGIIPVHLYGQMADMDGILELAAHYNLIVIEDACQAHGAAIDVTSEEGRGSKFRVIFQTANAISSREIEAQAPR